jgi:ATP-binding cassette subfamily C protein CydCD
LADLSRGERRALGGLVIVSLLNALGLVLVAEAISRGIPAAIAGPVDWAQITTLGGVGLLLRAAAVWMTSGLAATGAREAQVQSRRSLLTRTMLGGGVDLTPTSGELTVLATSGLAPLDAWYSRFLPALAATLTVPAVVGLRILWADWVSALIIVLTLPLIPVFMMLIGQETRERVQAATSGLQRLARHLVELARGLPVLVGLGRAEAQVASLGRIADQFRQQTMATLRVAFLSSLALELISTLSVAVVAVFIGVRLVHGSLDLQTGLLVLVLAPECYLPLRQVGAAFHAAEDGQEARRRVRKLTQARRPDNAIEPDPAQDFAGVRDLTIHYAGRSRPAVEGFSLTLAPGRKTLLRGNSGSGKSSVIATLVDQLPAGVTITGTVVGVDLERVAYLPQRPALVSPTVVEEVSLYGGDLPEGEALRLLDQVGVAHLARRHPAELSAGEVRRVALARTLARVANGASIVILDEPTAHLDDPSARLVIQAIASLSGNAAVLIVSHDERVVAIADQVVHLGGDPSPPEFSLATTRSNQTLNDDAGQSVGNDAPEREARWSDLWVVVGSQWLRFGLAVLAGVLTLASALALAALSAWLIVRASEQPPILFLLGAIVGVRFFGIGRAVFRYVERLWSHDATLRSMTDVRLRIWRTMAAQGPSISRRLRGERAVDYLVNDVDTVRDLTLQIVIPLGAGIGVSLLAVLAATWILPVAGAALVVFACAVLVAASATVLASGSAARRAEVRLGSVTTRLTGALIWAAPDLRANRLDDVMLARLNALEAETSAALRRSAWTLGGGSAIVTAGGVLASLTLLAVGSRSGEVSPGMLAALVLMPMAMIEPWLGIVEAVQRWPGLRLALGRLLDDVERKSPTAEQGDSLNRKVLTEPIQELELRSVSGGWPGAEPVLRDVSTAVKRGSWLSVTGPSGSGKSTLLSLLMAYLRPCEGTYDINGCPTAEMTASSIRRQVAWCPQDAYLFDSTIRANLLLARSKEHPPSLTEMNDALERAGLTETISTMSDGLATRIGEGGRSLSGGERQRLAIARMLLTQAPVMLIDEPTAHLDDATADQLMVDLRQGLSDHLVVVVTHRARDIGDHDRRLVLGSLPTNGPLQ